MSTKNSKEFPASDAYSLLEPYQPAPHEGDVCERLHKLIGRALLREAAIALLTLTVLKKAEAAGAFFEPRWRGTCHGQCRPARGALPGRRPFATEVWSAVLEAVDKGEPRLRHHEEDDGNVGRNLLEIIEACGQWAVESRDGATRTVKWRRHGGESRSSSLFGR